MAEGYMSRSGALLYAVEPGATTGLRMQSEVTGKLSLAAKGEPYSVGPYNEMKGTIPGYDAHHAGQATPMERMIPDYDRATAPSIVVPREGHTFLGPNGIVSRSTSNISTPRDLIARDIYELRRVYPEIPKIQLQELIRQNKRAYPNAFRK